MSDWISKGQLYQVIIVLGIVLGSLLIIFASFYLNGRAETISWIYDNIIIVAFIYSIPIALIPVYHKLDDRATSILKQAGFSSLVLGFSSFFVYVSRHTVEDPSLFQSVIYDLSGVIVSVTFFAFITAIIFGRRMK